MGDQEGDWCAPELLNPDDSANDDEVIVEVEDATEDSNSALSTSSNLPISSSSSINPHLKNEDYLDLEDESLALDDASTSHNSNAGALASDTNGNNCKLLQARRYDVSITYDNYYRTPRIWMFGK
jgi:ubiquitin-like-conjugating enzyme ATG3